MLPLRHIIGLRRMVLFYGGRISLSALGRLSTFKNVATGILLGS